MDFPMGVVLSEPGLSGLDLLERLLARPAWHTDAACRGQGPDRWFPGTNGDSSGARAVCASCPVTVECAGAGRRERHGIWAGVGADRLRRQRPAAA